MIKKNKYLENFKNLKVLITGTTGFKGSWLAFWLNKLNAKVIGIGLPPEKNSIIFKSLKLHKRIEQYYFNIANFKKLDGLIKEKKPDLIIHLAAQSIVSESQYNPLLTFNSNIIGSANILESFRINKIPSLVYITSDKCYLNLGKKISYKESDILGGSDNYSASKASAEILFFSYFKSYFSFDKKLRLASARAGNVIGGGDFKKNRIVPDFFKSYKKKSKLVLRNPSSTRPWQHVLEPLSGYLKLSYLLLNRKLSNELYPSWNFGPLKKNCKTVLDIINLFYKHSKVKKNYKILDNKNYKEAKLLSLNIEKARNEIAWQPKLTINESIAMTAKWYMEYFSDEKVIIDVSNAQIDFYTNKLNTK